MMTRTGHAGTADAELTWRPQEDGMTGPDGEEPTIDLRMQDPAMLEEIDLYSELMIVAAGSVDRLSTAAIDRALGVQNSARMG
jgi:hypothetical protein